MQHLLNSRLLDSGAVQSASALPCSLHGQPASSHRPAAAAAGPVSRARDTWECQPVFRGNSCAARSPVACWATAEAPLEREAAPLTFTWPTGFEQRYELGEVLGRGSFGTVRTAFDRHNGRTLAAKILCKTKEGIDPERIAHRIKEEVSILLQVQDCPEALELHGVYQNATHVFILTDYCRGGNLEQFLQAQGVLTEQEAAQVAHDVLRVLAACHEQGILYADIKPANFLLAQPYPDTRDLIQGIAAQQPIQIRVADFGCATRVVKGDKLHKRTGTPLYLAPELFMQYYGLESDLWALGILLYQTLSRKLPFWEDGAPKSPHAIMAGILNGELKFEGPEWSGTSADAKDLISRMLDRDYNSRITAAQALEHPWIRSQCGDVGCVLEHNAVDMSPDDLGGLSF